MSLYIPCGIRCHTKDLINKKYGIKQQTLPFDNGFFTPESIKKILEAEHININLENTIPCIKTERYKELKKTGIKFVESSYDKINRHIQKNGYDNSYLDSTKGYYTLCKEYGCVFAHYNWHPLSKKSVTDPQENLLIIEEILNRRKDRLIDMIKKSNTLHICWHKADIEFIKINTNKYNICESDVKKQLIKIFSKYNKKIIFHKFNNKL